nr:uncharacterized abhydrolase domain-containing protein DDB_G0269086-like [Aegilops tauschii subsp. strangulata]
MALLKRVRDYAAVDQPMPVVKKKKESATIPETQQLATAAPPLAQKDGDGSRASAAGSSSRDSESRPQEKAISVAKPAPEALALSSPAEVPKALEPPAPSGAANLLILAPVLSPPPSIMLSGRGSLALPAALEEALSALTQLRDDLQGTDHCLVATWSQDVAASEEGKQAAGLAAVALDAALRDAEATKERCRVAEVELETLRNERAAEARQREAQEEKLKAREDAAERDRLEKLKKEVEAEKARLEAKAKILANDRAAFDSLEQRSCKALRDLYGRGLKEPLVTAEEGPAELPPQLVTVLGGIVNGVSPTVEGEACTLSASTVTCVFSHLHLRNPSFDFEALLEPVDLEHYTVAAEAMKDQVEALLWKFLAIELAPTADGDAEPTAAAYDTGGGDVVNYRALLAGDGSAQG